MKLFCNTCGCHFPHEYEDTLKEGCSYWKQREFPDDFPDKYRKIIWDALTSVPYDEIADKYGLLISTPDFKVVGHYTENQFERDMPGYGGWPDKKRQLFQKEYFIWMARKETGKIVWKSAIDQFTAKFDEMYEAGFDKWARPDLSGEDG